MGGRILGGKLGPYSPLLPSLPSPPVTDSHNRNLSTADWLLDGAGKIIIELNRPLYASDLDVTTLQHMQVDIVSANMVFHGTLAPSSIPEPNSIILLLLPVLVAIRVKNRQPRGQHG